MARFGRVIEALRRVERQHQRILALEHELLRLSPQVAALEERLESLRGRVEDPRWTASTPEQAEARSLIEEVRREHAQIRARISAATVFEERLRRLEEANEPPAATGGAAPGS